MTAHAMSHNATHQRSVERVRTLLHDRRFGPRARARLAADYEYLAAEPKPRKSVALSASIPVQRRAIREAHTELLDIAARLRAEPPPREDGVRAARRLVTDGAGPVYVAAAPDELRAAARSVLDQL